jgi:hypothetical protein
MGGQKQVTSFAPAAARPTLETQWALVANAVAHSKHAYSFSSLREARRRSV